MNPAVARTASAEADELEFRLRAVRLGIWVTLVMASAIAVYAAMTWDRPHRGLILAVCAIAVADAGLIRRIPHRRLALGGRHDLLLFAWNAGHVVMAGVLASLDGGPTSPLVSIFFVSVAFSAVSLPFRHAACIALLDVLALVLSAAAAGDWPALLVPWAARCSSSPPSVRRSPASAGAAARRSTTPTRRCCSASRAWSSSATAPPVRTSSA